MSSTGTPVSSDTFLISLPDLINLTADINPSAKPPSAKPSIAFLNLPSASVSSGLDAKYSVTGLDSAGTSSTKSERRASIGSNTVASAIAPAMYGAALPVPFTALNAGPNPVKNCDTPLTKLPVTVLGSPSIVGVSTSLTVLAAFAATFAPVTPPPRAIVNAPATTGSTSIRSAISATASNAPATACLGASTIPPAISLNTATGLSPISDTPASNNRFVCSYFRDIGPCSWTSSAANCCLASCAGVRSAS